MSPMALSNARSRCPWYYTKRLWRKLGRSTKAVTYFLLFHLGKYRPYLGKASERASRLLLYTEHELSRILICLSSNLSYKKIEKNGQIVSTSTHESGSILTAAALIAGTTIGAGALAMPAVTVSAGFLPSTAALLVSWFYMTISGLLIAELVINRIGQTGRTGVGLLELFSKNLGGPMGYLGSIAYFFLHYAVMVAYIFQGGSNLGTALNSLGLESLSSVPGFDQSLYAVAIALFVYFAKPSLAQGVNNALVFGTIASFAVIMGLAWDLADFPALVAAENQHPVGLFFLFSCMFWYS